MAVSEEFANVPSFDNTRTIHYVIFTCKSWHTLVRRLRIVKTSDKKIKLLKIELIWYTVNFQNFLVTKNKL
jgi:hypothetical protein